MKSVSVKPTHNKILSEHKSKFGKAFRLEYPAAEFKQASCAGLDTEFFFPNHDRFLAADLAMYRKVCASCPVLDMCKEWAVVHERYGVWGGLVPLERKAMREANGWALVDPTSGMARGYRED